MYTQEDKKSYYAIIPANVRYDKDLTPNAKLLYGEITALCNEKGYCWANNEYFANLYGVSKVSASKWISQLVEKGYIRSAISYKDGTKEVDKRYLSIIKEENIDNKTGLPIKEIFDTPQRKVNDPIKEKFNTPIKEKLKDNNTLFNNTINNTKDINTSLSTGKPDNVGKVIELISKLDNLPGARKYTDKRKKSINARIDEYGLEMVINTLNKMNTLPFFVDNKSKKSGWYDIDWVFNPNNFIKVIEGKYDNIGRFNNYNTQSYQPYIATSHQSEQPKELIKISETDLPF